MGGGRGSASGTQAAQPGWRAIHGGNHGPVARGEKVCFDIGGNKWRIIATVAYKPEIVFIVWIGTHAEYEKL